MKHLFFSGILVFFSIAAHADHLVSPMAQLTGCEGLDKTEFSSINLYDVGGLSPVGPAYGHWTVEFRDGKLKYSYSDISGIFEPYTCTGAEGEIQSGKNSGFYLASEKTLLWNGKWYRVK